TGASTGIGRELARGLALAGARLLLISRDAGRAGEAGGGPQRAGPRAPGGAALRGPGAPGGGRRVGGGSATRAGGVGLLVTNAALIPTARELDASGLESALRVNLLAPALLTELLLPQLERRAPSRVVHLVGRSLAPDWDDLSLAKGFTSMTAYGR